MTLKHVLKHFSKTEVQEDKTHPNHLSQTILNRLFGSVLERKGELSYYNNAECYPLPLREREELLCERSELSNSGEGCKDLPSPDATRHPLPREGNKVSCVASRQNKTHPNPPLEREGVSISCAEHTEKDLSSNRLIVLTTLKKVAFTLAEVLITLAIIGVVAALTIPNVIKDYQKKQTVVQLRKVYNDINNAVKLSEIDNGPMSQWDYIQTWCDVYKCMAPFLEKYYLPYFKDAQLLKWSDIPNYSVKGKIFSSTAPYIRLNNGVLLNFFSNLPSGYIWLYADINGEKGPNKVGRDIFVFDAYKNAERLQVDGTIVYRIKFWNNQISNKDDLRASSRGYSCRKDNNDQYANFNCGRLIELNDWEIPKDYPW